MVYFSKEEMIRCYRDSKQDRCNDCKLSQAVKRMPNGIDENVEALVDVVLDPARKKLGKAICVNSGFRCPRHNQAMGGAVQSQHTKGQAADIIAGSPEENLRLAKVIAESGKFDQMILYVDGAGTLAPRFIHVSWKREGGNRREVLKSVKGDSVKFRKVDINVLK